MPQLTYHKRLQVVLSNAAKRWKTVITVHELIHEICEQFLKSGATFGPRYRVHILDAIQREVLGRRLRRDNASLSIQFTPVGLVFYKEWGTVPLYGPKHPRMRYLSIQKLHHYSVKLFQAIMEMHDAFEEFRADGAPHVGYMEALPAAVEGVYVSVENLEQQNSALQLELNYQEGRKLRLLQLLAARGHK
ncbi:hypothetical protein VTO73DRAFT_3875 [Trametes versicolor]